jgi:F-type H+-transporting ATPase subunit epsilon
MADPLQVELVAADRLVWSGQAVEVMARTSDGELGILADHTPVLSVLVPTVVTVKTSDNTLYAAVSGGFLSVAQNRIAVLAEQVELAHDIDLNSARAALDEAQTASESAEEDNERLQFFEARLRAAEKVA